MNYTRSGLTVERMLAQKERWCHSHFPVCFAFAGVLWKWAHCRPLSIVSGPHNTLKCNVCDSLIFDWLGCWKVESWYRQQDFSS